MSVMSDPRFRDVMAKFAARTTDDGKRLAALAERVAPDAADVLAEIGQLAHRLAGAAGTFGFLGLSTAARALDECVAAHEDPDRVRGNLQRLLTVIDDAFLPR